MKFGVYNAILHDRSSACSNNSATFQSDLNGAMMWSG
jgi:hypothetical protein